jgi:hypothetical protein
MGITLSDLGLVAQNWPLPWATASAEKLMPNRADASELIEGQGGKMRAPDGTSLQTCLGDQVAKWPPLPWGTPRASDTKGTDNNGHKLARNCLDAQAEKDFPPSPPPETITGPGSGYSALIRLLCQLFGVESEAEFRAVPKQLNPRFVELLMGWPLGWSSAQIDSDSAATGLSGNRRQPQPCACGAD